MFDCEKMKSKCKAACCSPIPIQETLWEKVKHKVVRPVKDLLYFESVVVDEDSMKHQGVPKEVPHVLPITDIDPLTKSHRCPFLTYDLKCNIYEDRPFVCSEFGKESHVMMKCCYQDKEGRCRSRQEIRAVNREQCKQGGKISDRICRNASGQLIQLSTSGVK